MWSNMRKLSREVRWQCRVHQVARNGGPVFREDVRIIIELRHIYILDAGQFLVNEELQLIYNTNRYKTCRDS